MKVRHYYTLHPKSAVIPKGTWMVVIYVPAEPMYDSKGGQIDRIKAVGIDLPTGKLMYDLDGVWERNSYGPQFNVNSVSTVIEHDRAGIIGFLSSGEIKGCGPKMAERIYDLFGDKTLDIIEYEPDRLLEVKGISNLTVSRIVESYRNTNSNYRNMLVGMSSVGISEKLAKRIYAEFKDETMDVLKTNPYKLCEISGLGFKKIDQIALRQGYNPVSEERICQGILYALSEEEALGNICTNYPDLLNRSYQLLCGGELVMSHIEQMIDKMVCTGKIIHHENAFYRAKAYEAEFTTAVELKRLLFSPVKQISDVEEKIMKEERYLKIVFNTEQRNAVRTALTNSVSIITGGPGTGKTSTMVGILDIFHKEFPEENIVCCAPTAQAARRMYEATGYPAYTIHKTLSLTVGDETAEEHRVILDAGIVLADEFSMTDAYLAPKLFAAIKSGARVVIIGDVNQLPSVGPGAVLRKLIDSEVIPTVRLVTVYRNAGLIALNAKRINQGSKSLDEDATFRIMEIPVVDRLVESLKDLYLSEVNRVGIENVILLSPQRRKTKIGVNEINRVLQEAVNPPTETKRQWEIGNLILREGDRVVQMRNTEFASNGEIGTVRKIGPNADGDEVLFCEFSPDRIYPYDEEACENLDLAYCNTVHKAQGAEFKSVIIICHHLHKYSLTKPLLYTAVTRAKEMVTICGNKAAMFHAIDSLGSARTSHLDRFLKHLLQGGINYDNSRFTA